MNKYEKAVAILDELPPDQDRILSAAFDEFIRTIKDLESELREVRAQLAWNKSPAESCLEERNAGNGGCGACALCCSELLTRAETAEFKIKKFQAEHRLRMQEYDCCYGDTPGLIHCSFEKPCMSHVLEKVRHRLDHAIVAREEALASNDKLRDTLRRYELESKEVPPEGGGLT